MDGQKREEGSGIWDRETFMVRNGLTISLALEEVSSLPVLKLIPCESLGIIPVYRKI